MKLFVNIFLIVISIVLVSCEKDSEEEIIIEENWTNITVGDETNSNINDSLFSISRTSKSIDLNNDGELDIEFTSVYSTVLGGQSNTSWSSVQSLNNCSIISDTTTKQVTKIVFGNVDERIILDSIVFTPQKLDSGYLIDDNQIWSHREKLDFAFSKFKGIQFGNPLYIFERRVLIGWADGEKNFLGFKIETAQKTIYGYIEIIDLHSSNIEISKIVYR